LPIITNVQFIFCVVLTNGNLYIDYCWFILNHKQKNMLKIFKYAKSYKFSKKYKNMQHTFLYFGCIYHEINLYRIRFRIICRYLPKKYAICKCLKFRALVMTIYYGYVKLKCNDKSLFIVYEKLFWLEMVVYYQLNSSNPSLRLPLNSGYLFHP